MLEATQHEAAFFVTLTYKDEFLPKDKSVSPIALSNYVKRVRKEIYPDKMRYYGVGEYGDKRGRPHYHLLCFGLTRLHTALASCWNYGKVDVQLWHKDSDVCSYVASYVTKRMTKPGDPRLNGRHPEFARMSLKPGIGAGAMPAVANGVLTKGGALYVVQTGDVPRHLRMDGKKWSLGRYLTARLRDECGYEQPSERGVFSAAYTLSLEELQAKLQTLEARKERELTREQHARIAEVRESIARSKKGQDYETQ